MFRPRRILLVLAGLLVISVACCALVYAWAPIERQRDVIRPAPTLFVPPP